MDDILAPAHTHTNFIFTTTCQCQDMCVYLWVYLYSCVSIETLDILCTVTSSVSSVGCVPFWGYLIELPRDQSTDKYINVPAGMTPAARRGKKWWLLMRYEIGTTNAPRYWVPVLGDHRIGPKIIENGDNHSMQFVRSDPRWLSSASLGSCWQTDATYYESMGKEDKGNRNWSFSMGEGQGIQL